MGSKTEILGFDELARFHGLSLMKLDEDNYASENTQLANDFFEVGQQSKQDEVDELQKKIEVALEYIGPSDDISHKAYRDLYKILKGE